MRKFLILTLVLLTLPAVAAQRPRVSPHETHSFTIDGSRITIEYGRPSKKGRAIWGGLVPWGKWWMPGADESTTIRTTDTLVVGDLTVPAGEHTIYMWPDEKASRLIINNRTGTFHTFYDASSDLGRVDFPWKALSAPVEQLTFTIEPRDGGGGTLRLSWDDREYSVDLKRK